MLFFSYIKDEGNNLKETGEEIPPLVALCDGNGLMRCTRCRLLFLRVAAKGRDIGCLRFALPSTHFIYLFIII